jgi:multidrug efflux pump subunit AcrA (membrane-fusion protein)
MSVDLFRPQAVRASSDPDQRGGLLMARPPSGGWPFFALGALLAALLGVALSVRVGSASSGRGEVRAEPRAIVVRAPAPAVVQGIAHAAGDPVRAGDVLVTTDGAPILAPIAARVAAMEAAVGDSLRAGDPVARLTPADARLVGRLILPARDRHRVRAGDVVRLELDELPADQWGAASGRVTRVLDSGRPGTFIAEVGLERMPPGVEEPFRAGMTFRGRVSLGEEPLVDVLFPWLGRRAH